MKYITIVNEQEFTIEIDHDDEIRVNGAVYAIDFESLPDAGVLSLLINRRSIQAVVERQEDLWQVLIAGEIYEVLVQDERAYRLSQARGKLAVVTGDAVVKSPMPGLVLKTPVEQGAFVEKGQTLIILESMKMENELKAPRAGRISRVHVSAGANVEKGQALITVSDPEDA